MKCCTLYRQITFRIHRQVQCPLFNISLSNFYGNRLFNLSDPSPIQMYDQQRLLNEHFFINRSRQATVGAAYLGEGRLSSSSPFVRRDHTHWLDNMEHALTLEAIALQKFYFEVTMLLCSNLLTSHKVDGGCK